MTFNELANSYSYTFTYNPEDGNFFARVEEIPSIVVFAQGSIEAVKELAVQMVVYYLEELSYEGELMPVPLNK